jgi:hypothetical protein
MTKFEVGKFYAVQVGAWSRNKIPSLCIRTTKCTVTFQHLRKETDGRIVKYLCKRRKKAVADYECAYVPDTWSMIANTNATELANKPKMWDEVKEVY